MNVIANPSKTCTPADKKATGVEGKAPRAALDIPTIASRVPLPATQDLLHYRPLRIHLYPHPGSLRAGQSFYPFSICFERAELHAHVSIHQVGGLNMVLWFSSTMAPIARACSLLPTVVTDWNLLFEFVVENEDAASMVGVTDYRTAVGSAMCSRE